VALLLLAALAPARLTAATPSAAAREYDAARRSYFALQASPQKQRFRHHWVKVIAAFRGILNDYPASLEAPRAAYTAAELWSDLYRVSRRASDLDQALASYDRVVEGYPKSSLADDALWQQARLERQWHGGDQAAADRLALLLDRYPNGDMQARARRLAKELPAARRRPRGEATLSLVGRTERGARPAVTGVRQWSNADYSRIAVDLSAPAQARTSELAADAAANAPARLVVDIEAAALGESVAPVTEVGDALVSRLRVAPREGGVRLVVDLEHPAAHRVMVLENPFRVVVDVLDHTPTSALVAARRQRVVIDPGHGGKDSGARGPHGVLEKDVVLAIARQVAADLEGRGVEVTLTRTDDTFVPLEERTALANRAGADLFISVHANSHRKKDVRGIETYYLNVTDDRYALRLAALENQTNEEQVGDVQLILADLSIKASTARSQALARDVQARLIRAARKHKVESRDLGVKPSLFYVLLGARMPSILVETSFISNATEEQLLTNPRYQAALASAIAQGAYAHLGDTPQESRARSMARRGP